MSINITFAIANTIANANFRETAKLLMDAIETSDDGVGPERLAECLQQLNALPNQAGLPGPGLN